MSIKGPTVWILWDKYNQLVHGVHDTKDAANDAIRDFATQPGHDYDLTAIEVPGR